MDTVVVSTLATFLLALAGTWYVFEPFFVQGTEEERLNSALNSALDTGLNTGRSTSSSVTIQEIHDQKERVFRELEEITAQKNSGEMSLEQYETQRREYLTEAAKYLRMLSYGGAIHVRKPSVVSHSDVKAKTSSVSGTGA